MRSTCLLSIALLSWGCADETGSGSVRSLVPNQPDLGEGADPDAGPMRPPIVGGGRPDARLPEDRGRPPRDAAGPEPDAGPAPDSGGERPPPPPPLEGETIGEFVSHTCFNEGDDTPDALLDGLSPQLVRAINCVQPGTLADIPNGDWQMLDPRRPALVDGRAIDDLVRAMDERDATLVMRWTYRDVALQHLFYLWTLDDCDFAARPGRSNHQDGLAVDLDTPGAWRAAMRAHGWVDNVPGDAPHFNYTRAEDLGLGPLSLVAFQALWNLNVPHRALPLSGDYDAATAQALTDSPLQGFPLGLCEDGPNRPPPTVGQAAWEGCDLPVELVEDLGDQIAEVLRCAEPDALAPMTLCGDAGCLAIQGPPKPEWLEAQTHEAIVAASRALGRPIPLQWGWRGPAVTWFLDAARARHGCGDAQRPDRDPLVTGRSVRLGDAPADLLQAVEAAGFRRQGDVHTFEAGADLRALSIFAFQRLWNANRPEAPLPEDGRLGPATRAALDVSPPTGFAQIPCAPGGPAPGPAPVACVDGCQNQSCPGRYEFCHALYGHCGEVPCDGDVDCGGLEACDDPDRGSNSTFYCDDGRCRRR